MNEAKADKLQMFTNNLRSNTVDEYVKEFITNEAFRKQSRSDQIYLFHEIVSFSAVENNTLLTPELLDDLAHEYMRLRGNTGVMLGAVHRDKGHVHIHFCVSALHFRTGKSFGLGKAQLLELKSSYQKYHQLHYPQLSNSAPAHGKGGRYMSDRERRAKMRESVKERVSHCLLEAKSQSHFLELLRQASLPHYERGAKPAGVEVEGIKFRFSRILEPNVFELLPNERSEEQRVLSEIAAIRARQKGHDRDIEERER
ncbi:relaxase/mobilization nuclease domain-containing protein [Mucilaginibacter sp. HMF5004]|uniref:relaxase/mobilization nuclease domain-containing protein n=1 Tax=Mucilaginibacter rivuli TaxID=2857527 RepID=UPI001C5F8A31|nr:relaxase/mobilization nuclease domain-containing protein [Mucilaginibacter rivuli]